MNPVVTKTNFNDANYTQGPDKPLITFKRGEVIKLPLKRKRNRVFLTPEVASTIVPKEVKPGVNLSTLTGYLQVKDNLHNITVTVAAKI